MSVYDAYEHLIRHRTTANAWLSSDAGEPKKLLYHPEDLERINEFLQKAAKAVTKDTNMNTAVYSRTYTKLTPDEFAEILANFDIPGVEIGTYAFNRMYNRTMAKNGKGFIAIQPEAGAFFYGVGVTEYELHLFGSPKKLRELWEEVRRMVEIDEKATIVARVRPHKSIITLLMAFTGFQAVGEENLHTIFTIDWQHFWRRITEINSHTWNFIQKIYELRLTK